jgi:hypothetical protein
VTDQFLSFKGLTAGASAPLTAPDLPREWDQRKECSPVHPVPKGMVSDLFVLHFSTSSSSVVPNLRCSTIHSNNLVLIQSIGKQLTKQCWYPNNTLSSEWDIMQAIICTLALFLITPSISHVKSHQDQDNPYTILPLEAQLNVDVDVDADSKDSRS